MRVGMGYDIHRLKDNIPFILGGIRLDHFKGVEAHSDGDILFHALADALLGAACLGDIGHFFPDTDLKYKNMDSSLILSSVIQKLKDLSFIIINVDITIVLEKPKLQFVLPDVKKSIDKYLNIGSSNINVKATTSEGMGFIGTEHGVACYAVTIIEKI
ncbi:MAG: 2-C-methyl-D-erythritol 2,4-cyclodiphosphate synthase [Flavobacteriales bacterium]|nr:2-C-methyl-D-erythritol 2,4-cyclodiphosphate synthase [Flavobacteriales bacterium]